MGKGVCVCVTGISLTLGKWAGPGLVWVWAGPSHKEQVGRGVCVSVCVSLERGREVKLSRETAIVNVS